MVADIDRTIPSPNQLFFPDFVRRVLADEIATFTARRFEWGVVVWMAGIATYFMLPFEPDWRIAGSTGVILALMARLLHHKDVIKPGLIAACLMSLGIACSAWHTSDTKAPVLPDYERSYTVTGWIKHVEKSGNRLRWVISVTEMDDPAPKEWPNYVRIRVSSETFSAGDFVKVRARLSAPPDPVVPGGYDSARAAFFKQIGGYGYAIADPQAARAYRISRVDAVRQRISEFRYDLADRILHGSPEPTAGLQVALLTGIRIYIPEQQNEALRLSGLAHILAISGLHMGLVSGSLYFVFTFLLALFIPLSRRFDVRKPAACIGILAATAYLILSGASVATQRAYIMALVVFMAVILDQRAFSLRSVAIAALVTLMLHPEALVSVGFQMSFAAVTALIAVYQIWDRHRSLVRPRSVLSRFGHGFSSLSVTSLVAGSATGFFAAYHFKRMATFGLAGNLLAMPIFTFWVMPVALLVYAALPFGLESVPLRVMGLGLEVILWVANFVSSWPGAVKYFHQAGATVMAVFVGGFLILCLGHVTGRAVGVVLMGTGLFLWMTTGQPDMRISTHPAIAIHEQDTLLLHPDRRRDGFGRDVFAESLGRPNIRFSPLAESPTTRCDSTGCVMNRNGITLAFLNRPEALPDACANSDIVVMMGRPAGTSIRRQCQARLFDTVNLSESGALHLRFRDDEIKTVPANPPGRRARPWAEKG